MDTALFFSEGRVIKSVSEAKKGQELIARVSDGIIVSDIKDIKGKD